MREIKFRAWDTRRPKYPAMIYDWLIKDSKPAWFDYEHNTIVVEELTLMQYTGLKDKNGREIYEGDVLRWSDWEQEMTPVPDVCVIDWDEEEARYYMRCYRSGKEITATYFDAYNHSDHEWEVVGNIYENPELLAPQG